jgi:hypothetical protein
VLAAVLLPIAPTPVLAGPAAPVPAFFTSGQWATYVPDGQSVLSGNPRGGSASFTAMSWDNATGQGYRMVGGYYLVPDAHGRGAYGGRGRPTTMLLTSIVRFGGSRRITAAQRAAFRADVRYWHTAIVVLSPYAPHHDELRSAIDQLAGEPGRQVQGVLVWDVGK